MKPFKLISFSLLMMGQFLHAQSFKFKTALNKTNNIGLHKLELKPAHQLYMMPSYNDVRIYDSLNKEVPYVLLSEPVVKSKTDFVEYTIKSQTHLKNHTEIIIENPNKNAISNIAFNINNSDALKYCSIEGSDDLGQWFTVSELQMLGLTYNEDYTNQYKCIYFPVNNYSYFRLLVDDWSSEPFKVNSAGYFKNSVISGKLNTLETKQEISIDSKKKITTIKLTFPCQQEVNQLSFKISAPRLFLRRANVYTISKEVLKNKKTVNHINQINAFELNADKPFIFDVPSITTNELFIDIENNDNQPLQIDSVVIKQLAKYLIMDVANGSNYTLKCGDNQLQKPQYDLINFIKQSPQLLPELTLSAFEPINTTKNTIVKPKPFYEEKYFLWFCLLIAVVAISFFAWKLMKDLGTKE